MKAKSLLLLWALLATAPLFAQRITDIRFAYFKEAAREDNGNDVLEIAGYRGREVDAGFVSENPTTRAKITRVLQQLRANGSGDINKCFMPRHVVTVYSNEQVLYRVLLCFECDGVRFSNQSKTGPVKSVGKREKAMAELKSVFSQYHFNEKGGPQ
jgi:hypothetical protein